MSEPEPSEPAPEDPPAPEQPEPTKPPVKILKLPAKWCYAIREVIEAARFMRKPPVKEIANRRGLNHQRLKTYYNQWTHGHVDLSRGDSSLGEPVQQAIDQKVELARSLNICQRINQYLNDQLDGSLAVLKTMVFEERRTAFHELRVGEHIRLKMSLMNLTAATERGFLASVEANDRLARKSDLAREQDAKEAKVEVVSTTVTEIERFRSVFQAEPEEQR